MPEKAKPKPPPASIASIGATEARERFAELIGRVAFGKERVTFTRNGQDMGVLVPMEDYERLLLLEQTASDGEVASPTASRS